MSDFSDSERKTARQPAYQRIAASLRNDILSGKLSPGDMLPTTEEFAAMWNASYFTAHTALKALVKEGWVQRIHGRGTYVAHPDKRFLHAGIYHSLNIWSDEESHFQRSLNDALVDKFHALGKTTQIIIDSRPEDAQDEMFPPLAQAIFNRQIQCVVAPNVNSKSLPLLDKLTIPVAFMTMRPNHPGVDFDEASFLRGAIRRLADQGCRTIGFITNVPVIDGDFSNFIREVEAAGLESHPDWMVQPPRFQHHLQEYGFHAFRKIWKLTNRPQGVIAYPDVVARGVILAALQAGVRVPQEIQFVFHRNAHARVLCPFPVTWAISDEHAAADGLIAAIDAQFAGRPPEHVYLPFTLVDDDAARWNE
jgi:DNA-binding LacI/PurR family transcriptional regulator